MVNIHFVVIYITNMFIYTKSMTFKKAWLFKKHIERSTMHAGKPHDNACHINTIDIDIHQ